MNYAGRWVAWTRDRQRVQRPEPRRQRLPEAKDAPAADDTREADQARGAEETGEPRRAEETREAGRPKGIPGIAEAEEPSNDEPGIEVVACAGCDLRFGGERTGYERFALRVGARGVLDRMNDHGMKFEFLANGGGE